MEKASAKRKGLKNLLSLLLFCCILAPAAANAVDFKVSGLWQIGFQYSNVTPRHGRNSANDYFAAMQRFRFQLDFIASEQLSGSVQFKLGVTEWGKASNGGALGSDGKMVRVRHAYIDWMVPETDIKVRMGLQHIKLPGVISQWGAGPIWFNDMAGITVGAPLYKGGNFNLDAAFFWARPYNDNAENPEWSYLDSMDNFGLILPVRGDGFSVEPWVMYSLMGKYSLTDLNASLGHVSMLAPRSGLMPVLGDSHYYPWFQNNYVQGLSKAWGEGIWSGVSATFDLTENLSLALEGAFGSVDMGSVKNYAGFNDGKNRTLHLKKEGWYIGTKVQYKFNWGVPGLILWYGPGDDDDPYNGSERLPQYNTPWGVTSLGYGGGIWDVWSWKVLGHNPSGTFAAIAQIDKLSFIEKLSHTLRFGFFQGTNSPKMPRKADMRWPTRADGPQAYLTTTDNAWEVNLINNYKIYENLNIALEAAYVRLNLDGDTWRGAQNDIWKDNYNIAAVFTYQF